MLAVPLIHWHVITSQSHRDMLSKWFEWTVCDGAVRSIPVTSCRHSLSFISSMCRIEMTRTRLQETISITWSVVIHEGVSADPSSTPRVKLVIMPPWTVSDKSCCNSHLLTCCWLHLIWVAIDWRLISILPWTRSGETFEYVTHSLVVHLRRTIEHIATLAQRWSEVFGSFCLSYGINS